MTDMPTQGAPHDEASCIFCKIIRHEIPANIVYEDDQSLAFLDAHPNTTGHTLVISKEHAVNIFDVSEGTINAVIDSVRKLSPIIRDAVEARGVNINSNHGSAAGQEIFHLHIHIIPRFDDDGLEFTWPKQDFGAEKMREIAEKIRNEQAEGRNRRGKE